MDIVFGVLILFGIFMGMVTGNMQAVNEAIVSSAGVAVEKIFSLIGILTLWLGVAKIAEKSGLLKSITRLLQPFVRIFFPSVPKNHPAIGSILMNLSANLFGFGSAATPFGLKAMEELQTLNPNPETASDAMCTFLAINTSSVTLIPTTIISLRMASGSTNPLEIVGTTLFATTLSTLFAIIADFVCRQFFKGGR